MMQADGIQKQRDFAEKVYAVAKGEGNSLSAHNTLALWVIAEQLFELTHHLAAFREVIDPAAGESFPAVVRVRQEEK